LRTYTISEVADLAGVSATTVRNAIQAGKLEASKEPGPRGKYQVTREALDAWIAARQGNKMQQDKKNGTKEKEKEKGNEKSNGKGKDSDPVGLIPWDYVQGVQDKLHGAIYRAGQAEARVSFLSEEVSRLREQRDRERERLENRIRELENQLSRQQRDVLERMEARERAVLEFISCWRESAAAPKAKRRKPWWRILGELRGGKK
jgi:excisionase family DNA binding protein